MNWWNIAGYVLTWAIAWNIGFGRGVRYALSKIAQTQQILGDLE